MGVSRARGGDLLWVGWGRAEPWVTEDHLGVRGGGGHRTGSAAFPGRLPRPGLSRTCVWSGRGGAAGGAHPVRTRPPGCRRQGGRAGHRAGGGCVHRHWLGLRARRVGVPVARTHRESLDVPISRTAGASQGSGGGGIRAGEPRRLLTRTQSGRHNRTPSVWTHRLSSDPGVGRDCSPGTGAPGRCLPARCPRLGDVGALGLPVCRVAAGDHH